MTIADDTALMPWLIAESVASEASAFLGGSNVPWEFTGRLEARAEGLYRNNERFKRQMKGRDGRDVLYMFMRHWLAGELHKVHPNLCKQLPRRFANGEAA